MKSFMVLIFLLVTLSVNGQSTPKDAVEPILDGTNAVAIIETSNLNAWIVPSTEHWSINKGIITGDTKGKKLTKPQWLYTKQSFANFTFTIEVKLTGEVPNSGVYFRAKKITWKGRYEAPIGYEYDVTEDTGFNGSIGDFFARPKFRIRANQKLIDKTFQKQEWNRLTLRVQGNRLEYWMNGVKIQDYQDEDPKASLEGVIALQLHNAKVMKVEFRNAYYSEL